MSWYVQVEKEKKNTSLVIQMTIRKAYLHKIRSVVSVTKYSSHPGL